MPETNAAPTTRPILDPERIDTIFRDCLFTDTEPHDHYVVAEGITVTVGFHPERLESHREEVKTMLAELPDQFHWDKGGGWTFRNLDTDKHGNQWTGFHQKMEQLIQLGIGLGMARCLAPRKMWPMLPGGMPYYAIDLEGKYERHIEGTSKA